MLFIFCVLIGLQVRVDQAVFHKVQVPTFGRMGETPMG